MDLAGHLELNIAHKFLKRPKDLDGLLMEEM